MTYSPEQQALIKARVCKEIAAGGSLRKICAADDMPAVETVRQWLVEGGEFLAQYARAREEQADFYADEIIEIADTEPDSSKARNRIDARKWKASKLRPKVYGDKVDLNVSGSLQNITDEQLDNRLSVLLGKAGVGVAAGGSGETEGET